MKTVYLSLGSNHRAAFNLRLGFRLLWQIGAVNNLSPVYESAAVGHESALPYLNAVVAVNTPYKLATLKSLLVKMEDTLGRVRHSADGDKAQIVALDYDILFDSENSPHFAYKDKFYSLPHPDVVTQAHVAIPLADIAPDWQHPTLEKSAREIAAEFIPHKLKRRSDVIL